MKQIFRLFLVISFLTSWQIQSQKQEELLKYVNTLQGTKSQPAFSNGNTYPTVAVPYPMHAFSPQTGPNGDGWKYKYTDTTIRGFQLVHQCSPWVRDYATITLMPEAGELIVNENKRAVGFSHVNETAKPNYYAVTLDNAVKAEMSPVERGGMMRFSFPAAEKAYVVLDGYIGKSKVQILPEENKIVGWVNSGFFFPGEMKGFFVLSFDLPFLSYGTWENRKNEVAPDGLTDEGDGKGAYVEFKAGSSVQVKVSMSYISPEQAQLTMDQELGEFNDLDEVKEAAGQLWNDLLGRVKVEGGSEDDKATFYSCLFRSNLFSHKFYEINEAGEPYYRSPYDVKVHDGYMYTDNGFWDTFRSQFPLTNILHPTMQGRYMQSLLDAKDQCGYFPTWSCPGMSGVMIGNHAISLLTDAWAKGIRNFDPEKALEQYYHEITTVGPWGGSSGREGHEHYFEKGYIPYELTGESAAKTIEYAYDDWCAYKLAKMTGNKKYEEIYGKLIYNYKSVWDPETKYMRGRKLDGDWVFEYFNPYRWGNPFTEGNSAQYTWSVFHDVEGLIELMGGEEQFNARLDSFFHGTNEFDKGAYWEVIHEIKEMLAADMGQYAHGNQPCQHVPFLYSYSGQPWKTQAQLRKVMSLLYDASPEGYPGDEDQGGLSSWYVLNAMGIYSVCPGTDQYVLGSPLFDKVTITLEDGKEFVVEAENNSPENVYIQSAALNGEAFSKNWITYSDIIRGGKLKFVMGHKPNKERGVSEEDRPYSVSVEAQLRRLSLDSSNSDIKWQLKPGADVENSGFEVSTPGFEMDDYVEGIVPGIVFTSYVEAGLEKDPDFADNIYQVDETFYNAPFWYRTEFEIPSSYKEGQRVWLHFENTNRFADFYFNGKKISGTKTSTRDVSGHMLRSKFDVTDLINKSGKNAVAVLIYDANQKKTRDAKEGFGITASPTYLAAAGWDWMPYVPGRLNGITGNAYLEITGDVVIEDPWIRSELESNEIAYLAFQTALNNTSDEKKEVTVTINVQPGDIEVSKNITLEADENSKVYMNREQFEALIIENPKLWWPNGYGNPNLYTCNVTCEVEGRVTDEQEITFGIRKYEYRFVRNAAGWPVMTFYINGQKLFIKGGNWGMSEYLLRARDEEYEQKIRLHKDMNYNMIRLWTGCVTDDEFYEYCDKYGIMVWDDFWLYVAYNEVENREHFKQNALDKVRRLRNHPSIALWCGANETRPAPELDNYLRGIIGSEDHNDRMYKSSSNQDGLSGSGWWGNQPPGHHFEHSGSNLAWNNPPYPYGADRGYGLRSEIGTATFPVYESVKEFIPQDQLWPLPTDKQLEEDDDNVWNKHFFGKSASNANPINYKKAVNKQFGKSDGLEEFCEKAQFLNIEVMRGMYEAWNDKMWNDATGILIWMTQSAYPSFVWQTYDYYYDASGSYWGAKKAGEPLHIQWNSSSNSVKVINSTSDDLKGATAKARIFDLNGKEMPLYGNSVQVDVPSANLKEAFKLNFNPHNLANGKKVVASSQSSTGAASLAVDGGAGSRWESDYSDPQWIYVDLGKQEKVQKVVLKWENAFADEYEIQVSKDAERWETVSGVNNGDGATDEITVKPVKARYVRMNGLSRATEFGYSIYEFEVYGINANENALTPLHFISLELKDTDGQVISENFYWRNGLNDLDYTDLNTLPEADLSVTITDKVTNKENGKGIMRLKVINNSSTIAFGNRLRLANRATKERVLPLIMNENYVTLMPGEEKVITMEADLEMLKGGVDLLLKQYGQEEKNMMSADFL